MSSVNWTSHPLTAGLDILTDVAPFSGHIISVKPRSQAEILENEIAKDNQRRSFWHFLTLGIPQLIETLSIVFSGIVHRETQGHFYNVTFKAHRLFGQDAMNLHQFQNFNKFGRRPLKQAELNKILQCVNRLINKIDEAKAEGNDALVDQRMEELKPYQQILTKTHDSRITRNDFNENDWKVIDEISFELASEHFSNLSNLFNADWMVRSNLKEMGAHFGFDYNEATVAESLSLALAYIEKLDGKEIRLPVFDKEAGKYIATAYKIKSAVLGDALPCYILESEKTDVPGWFIIRGTQTYTNISSEGKECRIGSLESMLADSLDPDCISRNVINKSLVKRQLVFENGSYVEKDSLSDIFRRWSEEGKRINLAGHSLGGTIANALTVEFPDQVRQAYSFSSPGVSNEMAQQWKEMIAAKPEMQSRLLNFDYEGDIVPAGGKVLIGSHLAVQTLGEIGSNSLRDSHVRSRLNRDFQIRKVDTEAENKKFARGICEAIRIIVGTCFRFMLWTFSRQYMPDWWKNRNFYRESAALERHARLLSSPSESN